MSHARVYRRKEMFQPILQYLLRDTIVMLIHVLVLVKVSSMSIVIRMVLRRCYSSYIVLLGTKIYASKYLVPPAVSNSSSLLLIVSSIATVTWF